MHWHAAGVPWHSHWHSQLSTTARKDRFILPGLSEVLEIIEAMEKGALTEGVSLCFVGPSPCLESYGVRHIKELKPTSLKTLRSIATVPTTKYTIA